MFLSRPPESALSDDEHEADDGNDADSDEEDTPRKRYAFPELDQRIRECVKEYEAVFPKLNFSSPKVRRELKSIICIILTNPAMTLQDAAWLLPASSPLKCTSPSDVYLLLKSSDFINHDLSTESVFEGCEPESGSDLQPLEYELELVLRKWYPVDRGRELRCFVRDGLFIGTTYPFPYLIGSVLTPSLSIFSDLPARYELLRVLEPPRDEGEGHFEPPGVLECEYTAQMGWAPKLYASHRSSFLYDQRSNLYSLERHI